MLNQSINQSISQFEKKKKKMIFMIIS